MLTEEQIAELDSKHGRIAHMKGARGAWECVFRKPTGKEYEVLLARLHNPAQAPKAMRLHCLSTVVYPARADFEKLLEDYPGIPEASSKALQHLAGMDGDEEEKG